MRNIPDIFSISRLLLAVPVFIFILINESWAFLVASIVFTLGSLTDFLDGYLAKRLRTSSSLGVFLDLAADKIFVICTLIAMVQIALIPAWPVAVITAREFLVTGLRSQAASEGRVIPAKKIGKQKTLITMISIIAILFAKSLEDSSLLVFGQILLILATFWTIISAADYVKISLQKNS